MNARPTKHLARLSTGVAALDNVMGGGFPLQSVSVIAGEPGAGKTVLALQTMFAAARAGKRSVYFTTLSEPALKLIRYTQLFEFFDPELVDEMIHIHDLGSVLRSHQAEGARGELSEKVEDLEPDLVVIDSYKAIHDLIPEPHRVRTFTYDLAVQMSGWGATTLLLGEYGPDDIGAFSEFAIADGVIRVGLAREQLAQVRELEIRKLRGSGFVSGVHYFDIDSSGISFYPRVRGPEADGAPYPARLAQRVPVGVPGIDELLRGGGIPEASTTLVMGGTGTGKTLLGLHFLAEGARRGEPGVFLSLEETAEQLCAVGDQYGFDVTGLSKKDLLTVHYTPPVELSTDRYLDQVRELAKRLKAKRVVLDSLTSLSLGAVSERRYKELVYALGKHFRHGGVTLLSTMEIPELLGGGQLSGHGVSFAADNIIQLRYVEMRGRLERALSVVKARGVNLNTELRPFTITGRGIDVGSADAFHGLRGVLTGLPTSSAATDER